MLPKSITVICREIKITPAAMYTFAYETLLAFLIQEIKKLKNSYILEFIFPTKLIVRCSEINIKALQFRFCFTYFFN